MRNSIMQVARDHRRPAQPPPELRLALAIVACAQEDYPADPSARQFFAADGYYWHLMELVLAVLGEEWDSIPLPQGVS